MNSLRPLVTITILAVVGAWLYVKINEGPTRPAHGEAEVFPDPLAGGIPPLTAAPSAPPAEGGAAPKWLPTAAPQATPLPTPATLEPAPSPAGAAGLPEIPPIPALPVNPTSSQTSLQSSAKQAPIALPASIPQARYPEAANSTSGTSSEGSSASGQVGASTAAAIDATTSASVPAAVPAPEPATSDHEKLIAANSAMAAVGLSPQTLPTSPTTATETAAPAASQAVPGVDRYGQSATGSIAPLDHSAVQSQTTVQPTFAGAWPEIQAALERGDLAGAHGLLSKWYNHDSLTAAEADKVETLLGQLAGTVVYSTEHQLEPAYTVRAGQNLESIAKECNVPWQLLAKINGIPSVDAVQPGQQLKVVRGPFSAVVDLRRSQLTLLLDGRYAGRFPITVAPGTSVNDGQWLVDQKLAAPSSSLSPTAITPLPSAIERTIVLRGEDQATGKPVANGPALMIASSSAAAVPTAGASAIRVSPQDAEELSDILSVGSRVTIRK